MYESLNNFYFQVAETDSKIYPPPSFPIEKDIYRDNPVGHPKIPRSLMSDNKCTFLPVTNNFAPYEGSIEYKSKEPFKHTTPLHNIKASSDIKPKICEKSNLLPVLDPVFNLREICKQSILLEDHLTHDEKRCTDCCIKHFLALEGLCEEAITLDKEKKHLEKIKTLPKYVRQVAKKWYENPINNSLECAQMLRKMRKDFQEDSFNVVFDNFCNDNTCKLRN